MAISGSNMATSSPSASMPGSRADMVSPAAKSRVAAPRWAIVALVAPLLIFLFVAFFVPVGTMLKGAVPLAQHCCGLRPHRGQLGIDDAALQHRTDGHEEGDAQEDQQRRDERDDRPARRRYARLGSRRNHVSARPRH